MLLPQLFPRLPVPGDCGGGRRCSGALTVRDGGSLSGDGIRGSVGTVTVRRVMVGGLRVTIRSSIETVPVDCINEKF
eukprot:COSAG02_NODE_13688_length_1361_cov_81.926307_1_plen_77_part_00